MAILLSCLQSPRVYDIPAYQFWRDYFTKGIAEAGYPYLEVNDVDWARGITALEPAAQAAWRAETWSKTLDFVDRQQKAGQEIDLFLSYLYPVQVDPAAIAEIQRRGIPCANFFCDNVREFSRVPKTYHAFDLHWVPEWEALSMYSRAGLKTCFAPMPCWVDPTARMEPDTETFGPTFIGSHDLLRQDLLGRAIAAGADIMIRGPGWSKGEVAVTRGSISTGNANRVGNQLDFLRRQGLKPWLNKLSGKISPFRPATVPPQSIAPQVWGPEYHQVTRESKVTIGINRVPTFRRSMRNPLAYSRLRDIEAPMMGACYLTEWTEGLAQMYQVGRDIETYRTAAELADKLSALMADKARRRSLRQSGQKRALNDLSVKRSIERIHAALGLKGA